MNGNDRVPVSTAMKLVALLLMVGGVLGIGLTFWLDLRWLLNSQASLISATTAIMGVFVLLYGWAAWTGRDLWRGRRQALKFAQILFALQVPLITVPGFSYEFHTGLTMLVSIQSGPHLNFNFNLGSSFSFYLSSQVQGVAIGVNLVALTILVYLVQKSRELLAPPLPVIPTLTAAEFARTARAGGPDGQTPQA